MVMIAIMGILAYSFNLRTIIPFTLVNIQVYFDGDIIMVIKSMLNSLLDVVLISAYHFWLKTCLKLSLNNCLLLGKKMYTVY